jgi:hypothetical protein
MLRVTRATYHGTLRTASIRDERKTVLEGGADWRLLNSYRSGAKY